MVAIKEFAVWFYKSKAWRDCRNAYFLSQYGVCERCGAPGHIVHHKKYITPANIHDPSVTFDWHSLELLCDECHQKEHQNTRSAAENVAFDANGDLIQPPRSMEMELATKTTCPTCINPDSPFSVKNGKK